MADFFASLDGRRVLGLTLTLPLYGRWTADAELDRASTAVTGQQLLQLGGLEMVCTPARGGDFLGTTRLRLVGGYGGWGRTIPSQFYRSPGGVRLDSVVGDAARACGELVDIQAALAPRTAGPFFARLQGPASRVFGQLSEPRWWVRPEGVTRVGPREEPVVTSRFDVLPQGTDLGRGRVGVATDYPEDWQPGVRFSAPALGLRQASAVVHTLTADALRTTVWTTP